MKARHCHLYEKGDGVLGDPSKSLADVIMVKTVQRKLTIGSVK
jgi:hypothetical protein